MSAIGEAVWFKAPREVEIREEAVAAPQANEVTVRALFSGISQGSETLIYRGEGPKDQAVTPRTSVGESMGSFPIKYGYAVVGEVVAAGRESGYEEGELVFARFPHQSLFTFDPDERTLYRLPAFREPEVAVFGNILEVAANAFLDVPIRIGEVVAVHGLGVIGQFCAQIAKKTASRVIGIDPDESRRAKALELGIDVVATPAEARETILVETSGRGADVSIEVSGAPAALQNAIDATAFEGTVVVVSWYGDKTVPLLLAPDFHMKRLRMVSSQASATSGLLLPRWDRARRMSLIWELLPQMKPELLITHRFDVHDAQAAYDVFEEPAQNPLGVVLTYGTGGGR